MKLLGDSAFLPACCLPKTGSPRQRILVAVGLVLLAVVGLQLLAWRGFPDWVKQQVRWDASSPPLAEDDYKARVQRREWYDGLRGSPDPKAPWAARALENAARSWCDRFACPYSRLVQEPTPSGWWLANATRRCPDYFRWIQHDLGPWKETGVRLENVLAARNFGAHFRVVIVKGKMYVEYYDKTFETRGQFTLWGLALLLERYPGQVPDLDMVFWAGDWPTIPKAEEKNPAGIPFGFSYCTTPGHFNVPFPDWSFWGWPEVDVQPWEVTGESIFRAAKELKWEDRERITFWKGNPWVGGIRRILLECDASKHPESTIRVFEQNWGAERANGFKSSSLASHCKYRYMIYAEGNAWSVSYKFIMSCGSPMLAIASQYYEFFTRSLQPMTHFLPASQDDLCHSLDSQVAWGDSHEAEAKEIAQRGQRFMQEELHMDFVYDYMLHLLQAYSKLLKFKPTVPPNADELCTAKILCSSSPRSQEFMLRNSMPSWSAHRPCDISHVA